MSKTISTKTTAMAEAPAGVLVDEPGLVHVVQNDLGAVEGAAASQQVGLAEDLQEATSCRPKTMTVTGRSWRQVM